jgi:hypothetical protein
MEEVEIFRDEEDMGTSPHIGSMTPGGIKENSQPHDMGILKRTLGMLVGHLESLLVLILSYLIDAYDFVIWRRFWRRLNNQRRNPEGHHIARIKDESLRNLGFRILSIENAVENSNAQSVKTNLIGLLEDTMIMDRAPARFVKYKTWLKIAEWIDSEVGEKGELAEDSAFFQARILINLIFRFSPRYLLDGRLDNLIFSGMGNRDSLPGQETSLPEPDQVDGSEAMSGEDPRRDFVFKPCAEPEESIGYVTTEENERLDIMLGRRNYKISDFIIKEDISIILYKGNERVGWADVHLDRLLLNHIYVEKAYRGRGYSGVFLETVLKGLTDGIFTGRREGYLEAYVRNPLIASGMLRYGLRARGQDTARQLNDLMTRVVVSKERSADGKVRLYIADKGKATNVRNYIPRDSDWRIFELSDTPLDGEEVAIFAMYVLEDHDKLREMLSNSDNRITFFSGSEDAGRGIEPRGKEPPKGSYYSVFELLLQEGPLSKERISDALTSASETISRDLRWLGQNNFGLINYNKQSNTYVVTEAAREQAAEILPVLKDLRATKDEKRLYEVRDAIRRILLMDSIKKST